MKTIGFDFTKIKVEKLKNKVEKLKINSNINIKEIKKIDSNTLKIKEDVLGIKFNYELDFAPDFAKIDLGGNILIAIDPKMSKEILKNWENKEPLPKEFNLELFNYILKKATLKSLQLEQEINLPLHIKIPSFKN